MGNPYPNRIRLRRSLRLSDKSMHEFDKRAYISLTYEAMQCLQRNSTETHWPFSTPGNTSGPIPELSPYTISRKTLTSGKFALLK